MSEAEQAPQPTNARRRVGIALLVMLALFVGYDVILFLDLTQHGSPADLEHASERIGDLSTGPNAP